jgi:hypothetical protein
MGWMAVALAGGAIGALITLVVGLLVRSSTVPREIAANDRKVADRDGDLSTSSTRRGGRSLG